MLIIKLFFNNFYSVHHIRVCQETFNGLNHSVSWCWQVRWNPQERWQDMVSKTFELADRMADIFVRSHFYWHQLPNHIKHWILVWEENTEERFLDRRGYWSPVHYIFAIFGTKLKIYLSKSSFRCLNSSKCYANDILGVIILSPH